ncbi:MAG: hypothetical protein F6K39_45580, partial [Okeania sp. SIO3B3]|nr:hypothetical protein [Okeania sp. SIO3B3]
PSSQIVTVEYAATDITATAGDDYAVNGSLLFFAPSVTEQSFEVESVVDNIYEITETLALTLLNPNSNAVLGNDEATLTIVDSTVNPALSVAVTTPPNPQVGESIVLTFTVQHSAESDGSAIGNIQVYDDWLGPITSRLQAPGEDDRLDLGEVWVYTATYTITPGASSLISSTTIVSGTDLLNGAPVNAIDSYTLSIGGFNPRLFIDKDGPSIAVAGDTIVFTYTVIQLTISIGSIEGGDGSAVSNVQVFDPNIGEATYVSGDENNNNLLDPSEIWVFTNQFVVPDVTTTIVSTGIVTGLDKEGHLVQDDDTHLTYIEMVFEDKIFLPNVVRND